MRKHTLALAAAALVLTATLAVATTQTPAQSAGSAVTISTGGSAAAGGRPFTVADYIEELY